MLLAGLGCMSSVVVCCRTSCCSPGAVAPVDEAWVEEDILLESLAERERVIEGWMRVVPVWRALGIAGKMMFLVACIE